MQNGDADAEYLLSTTLRIKELHNSFVLPLYSPQSEWRPPLTAAFRECLHGSN